MTVPWELLKLVADPTRLRLVSLLAREELSAAELQEILGMGQSRISSHLSLLRQGDLVADRKEGKKTFYSFNADLPDAQRKLIDAAAQAVADRPQTRDDRANLQRVLDKRLRHAEE